MAQYKSEIESNRANNSAYIVEILQGWWKLALENPKGNEMYRAQCFIHGVKVFSRNQKLTEELVFLSNILETIADV